MDCTSESLIDASKCLCALTKRQLRASKTYLLCNIVSRVTPPCITPDAPQIFGSTVITDTTIKVAWKQLSNSGSLITGYVVYWGTTSGVYTNNSGLLPVNPKNYTITGLSSGTAYYMVIVAMTAIAGCHSANSVEINATTSGEVVNPLLTGLVALWTMDEDVASGTRVDVVGGNNLTDDNARIPAARGLLNGCALFVNGNSDSFSHVDNADLGMGAGVSFTLSFWVIGTALNTCHFGERSAGGTIDYDYEGTVGVFSVTDLGGTLRTITIAPTQNNQWHMVSIGYDDATGLMWQQFDAGARSTLAISGVRKSGQPFRITMDAGNVDQVALWKRSLSTAEITTLYNSRNGNAYPFTSSTGLQYANTWSWATQHNGGAAPAAATVTALGTMLDAFDSAGILGKQVQYFPLNADNLVAAITPVVFKWTLGVNYFTPVGNDPATNHNFIAGDLTINGLLGDAATKYLDLGWNANAVFSGQDSAIIVYDYTTDASAAGVDTGAFGPVSPNDYIFAIGGAGPLTSFDSYNFTVGQGRNNAAVAPGNGYYCGSRTAANASNIYFANSLTPHAAISTIATSGGTPSANKQLVFAAIGNDNSTVFAFSSARMAALNFTTGLSSAQSLAAFNAIQAFLVARGGGWR